MTADRPPHVDVLLADGDIASIRAFDRADAAGTRDLYGRASDESIRRRFFVLDRQFGYAYVDHLVDSDSLDTVALVAEYNEDIVALAGYERIGPHVAEIAFFVDDRMQGKGVGTLLLEHLAAVGRRNGIRAFVADVLVDNHAMIRVFRDAGFDVEQQRADGEVLELTMSTASTDRAVSAADARERTAEVRSLTPLLWPQVVAVAGASRRRRGVGREILENIRSGGFDGRLYAIHPSATDIDGTPTYANPRDLPERVDLLVVAVPADQVLAVVSDAAEAGTRSAIVITAGLAERDADGADTQQHLVQIARRHGMRLVGPNCLGLLNTTSTGRLNATFAALTPPAGGLAVASQSGGVGIALLGASARSGVGIRSFVSLGNKADVSGNDLLASWTDDPGVRAAALYLESFGNPRKFARFARRFAETKPLLAVVGGRSIGGQRAGLSHTAAAAAPSIAVDALCAQAGVIAVRELDELMETAHFLVEQPLPRGPRLGILGNAGGIGVLAADAAAASDLIVPELSSELQSRMSDFAAADNPIDLGAAASPKQYASAGRALLDSGEIDCLLIVYAATSVGESDAVMAAVGELADTGSVPVAAVLLGLSSPPTHLQPGSVPVYESAERAVAAIGHASRYAAWRDEIRRAEAPVDPDSHESVGSLAQAFLAPTPQGRWLGPLEVRQLLATEGISAPIGELAETADAAVEAAERVGFPVVLKSADPTVVHRTDRDLVLVGLPTADEVRDGYERMASLLESGQTPVLVQPYITGGVEIAVGAVRDPAFGPMVMVAAGGVATEVWDDRVFLLAPVTPDNADQAIRSLRIAPLLLGHRGSKPGDIAGLAQVVVAVARLANAVPELAELDLNPVVVKPDGVHCVDAKLRLAPGAYLDAGVPRRLADPR